MIIDGHICPLSHISYFYSGLAPLRSLRLRATDKLGCQLAPQFPQGRSEPNLEKDLDTIIGVTGPKRAELDPLPAGLIRFD